MHHLNKGCPAGVPRAGCGP